MPIGYIYVLSNPKMTGLLKVGYTRESVEKRARELSVATGVPVGFVIEYFRLTEDVEEIERLVHVELVAYRVNDNREFFAASVAAVIAAIERFSRPPISKFIREEHKTTCRRCGFRFVQSKLERFCPECGF